jgi:Domain of unknown function (DUF4440)
MKTSDGRWLWLPILLGLSSWCAAQEPARDGQTGEVAAVRRAAEAYISALGRGDSAQLVDAWTAEGDFVDSTGRVTKGRDLASQIDPRRPKTDGAESLLITVDSIRLVTPDVAIEDGVSELPVGDSEFSVARYTAVWVKRDSKWLLDSVRESAPHGGSHHDRLRPLRWLIGDWVQQGGAGNVEVTCRWSPDGNFLLRDIKTQTPDGQTLSFAQRIGWDAAKKQITAWTFDSEGGYGVGVWSRHGDQWLVRSTGVLPDGQSASSTSTSVRNGDDAFIWESTHSVGAGSPVAHRKVELIRRKSTEKLSSSGQH